jgi:hypothetical protein
MSLNIIDSETDRQFGDNIKASSSFRKIQITRRIRTEIANKVKQFIKIYYFMPIWSSTCFGWHTAHHQELKTALAASGFAYAVSVQQPERPKIFHVCKTRGCLCSFEFLMMGVVSPETCWASYKHGVINFDRLLHLVGYFCTNFTMMHGSTNTKITRGNCIRYLVGNRVLK